MTQSHWEEFEGEDNKWNSIIRRGNQTFFSGISDLYLREHGKISFMNYPKATSSECENSEEGYDLDPEYYNISSSEDGDHYEINCNIHEDFNFDQENCGKAISKRKKEATFPDPLSKRRKGHS